MMKQDLRQFLCIKCASNFTYIFTIRLLNAVLKEPTIKYLRYENLSFNIFMDCSRISMTSYRSNDVILFKNFRLGSQDIVLATQLIKRPKINMQIFTSMNPFK